MGIYNLKYIKENYDNKEEYIMEGKLLKKFGILFGVFPRSRVSGDGLNNVSTIIKSAIKKYKMDLRVREDFLPNKYYQLPMRFVSGPLTDLKDLQEYVGYNLPGDFKFGMKEDYSSEYARVHSNGGGSAYGYSQKGTGNGAFYLFELED